MSVYDEFNQPIIEEFRANQGRVGGPFEGAPMVLVHHRGRKSGEPRVTPMMYRADPEHSDVVYVFASKAGAPTHPAWYLNLVHAGTGSVEVGTEAYDVTVRELQGAERETVYAAQATDYPGFGEYAEKTRGHRVIPVLALTRVV